MNDTPELINDVRETFLEVLEGLREVPSFGSLLETTRELSEPFERIRSGSTHRRIQQECEGGITCAMIGSSAHGKTTVLDELFPHLSERGWLVTDVTDTTSQSLCIRHAAPGTPALDEVVVNSWDSTQIKELMSHPEVREQNEKDDIHIGFHQEHVTVDGSAARFATKDVQQFRFPRSVDLKPFPRPYAVPGSEAKDPAFIRSLTVKEQSAVMRTDPLIHIDGVSWDPLQLRAVVKDVSLRDTFDRVAALGGRGVEAVSKLTFVDTPGLATPGSAKDEVLRHFLEKKSEHIALQLWKQDELDVVIHLVLCGRSSDFATLWKQIERHCDDPDLDGLEDRLILAVNGMNRYFTDPNIKEKYEDADAASRAGDQFASTLESNILQNMSPRGRTKPARICFLDSKTIVEALTTGPYEDAYRKYRPIMERWSEPGGPGYSTLQKLGIVESFRENIDALCDGEDRGQGFLIRQLLELLEQRGPALLLRKFLVRSRLLHLMRDTVDLVDEFYDAEGRLNRQAVREAMRSCLSFLDATQLDTIESFAKSELDEAIDGIVPSLETGPDRYPTQWVPAAFDAMTELLLRQIDARSEAPTAIQNEFRRQFTARVPTWRARWGYAKAELESPSRGYTNSRELVAYSLKLHAREILWQLLAADGDEDAAFEQTEEDCRRIAELRANLSAALDEGQQACQQNGVNV